MIISHCFNFRVCQLNGDIDADVKTANAGHLIVTTPEKWDAVSRRGLENQSVALLILDQLHFLGTKLAIPRYIVQ